MVPDPDVLAPDLVEVVERGAGDRGARDLGRRQVGDRRQRPRPPDVRDDVLEGGLDLLRRELVGDRPARCAAHHPEPFLLVESVDLDHHAVGLVGQLMTGFPPCLGERDDALDIEPGLVIGVPWKPERRDAIERVALRSEAPVTLFEELVRPEGQQPTRGDRWVLLA